MKSIKKDVYFFDSLPEHINVKKLFKFYKNKNANTILKNVSEDSKSVNYITLKVNKYLENFVFKCDIVIYEIKEFIYHVELNTSVDYNFSHYKQTKMVYYDLSLNNDNIFRIVEKRLKKHMRLINNV